MDRSAIQRVVERRMREWELRASHRSTRPEPTAVKICPYVALTRTLGGRSREVADRLGDTLGWPVYDREILEYMAEDDDVQRRLYAAHDEQRASWLELMTAPFRAEARQSRDDYFHKLVRSVHAIAAASSAVFIGRGVGSILPAESGLRVRIVAPFERCVEHHAARTGLSLSEAAAIVRATNAARAAFLRDRFGEDWAAVERFDLTVNTATFTPDAGADLIRNAVERTFGSAVVAESHRRAS